MINPDLHIVKTEFYDAEMMDAILKDTEVFSSSDLKKLSAYKKASKISTNSVNVVYYYGKGCEENQLGRLYTHANIGLQAFPKGIRNPLLKKYYFDIDMENAHFNLMVKMGLEWGIDTTNIKYYCDHRNECLTMLGTNRTASKTAYLKVAYGGNIKLHDENINDDGLLPDGDVTMLKKIESEVGNMMNYCYSEFYEKLKKLVSKKDNPKASLFALILQTEEKKCLMALDEYLKANGRNADILIHDGLEVRKLENEKVFPEALLKGGEKAIFEKTGHTVKLAEKEIEHNYIIKKNVNLPSSANHTAAAKKFIELMGENIMRDGDDVYYYNNLNGMWDCNNDSFYVNVIKHEKDLFLYDNIKGKYIDYGGIEQNTLSMKSRIRPLLEDTNFIKNNLNSSIGKLLFSNGIYDFVTKQFKNSFDSKIVFFKRIDRPFPTKRNEELIKIVDKILFVDAFDIDGGREAGEYLKKVLTMSLFGDYFRKKFYVSIGPTNCGKSVLVDAMKHCFCGYVVTFDANNLYYNSNCSSDEAKRLSWIINLAYARLGFSSEIRVINGKVEVDGNAIKSYASGGDELECRQNFKNAIKIINVTTMIMMANDIPVIKPVDEAIYERFRFIKYFLKFVNTPTEEDERQGDGTVKLKFGTEEYKNALLFVILDCYNSMENSEKALGIGVIKEPKCVLEEKSDWMTPEEKQFKEIINDYFEITNNPTDYIECGIISSIIKTNGLEMSDNKIGRMLKLKIKLGANIEQVKKIGQKKK